jgi:hypothetical protein
MAPLSLPKAGNAFDGAVLGGRPALPEAIAGLEHSDPATMAALMRSALSQPCEPIERRSECEVLLIIFSAAGYERRRRMLRRTYLSLLSPDNAASPLSPADRAAIQFRFVLGSPLAEQATTLEAEQREHGDLVQLKVFESYETIWPKLVAAWRWSIRDVSFRFWMHADDDSYIRPDLLLAYLRQPATPTAGLYAGYIWDGSEGRRTRPLRDPTAKSYMPHEQWPNDSYPPFASGCGFILSLDLVTALVGASAGFSFFRTHDVAVGIELARLYRGRGKNLGKEKDWGKQKDWGEEHPLGKEKHRGEEPDRGTETDAAPLTITHLDTVRPYRPLPLFRDDTMVQHYLQPEEMTEYHARAYLAAPESDERREADARIAEVYDLFVSAKVLRR